MKSYCPDCNKKTPWVIKSKKAFKELFNKAVKTYETYCEMCGRDVYIPVFGSNYGPYECLTFEVKRREDGEVMTREEICWIDRCRMDKGRYRIDVDNDEVFVTDLQNDEAVFTFNHFGWELIIDLLRLIGCNAESV